MQFANYLLYLINKYKIDMKIEKGKLYYCISGGNIIKSAIDRNDESGDFTDKIAVHCLTKDDWDDVCLFLVANQSLRNKQNNSIIRLDDTIGYCVNLVSLGSKSYYEEKGYHIITIEEFKKFYTQTQTGMKPTHFAISPEEYQEWQEYKNSKKKPLELVYCMQSDGSWFKYDYSIHEDKEFQKLHKVHYKGIDYDLILIKYNNCIFLGHVN